MYAATKDGTIKANVTVEPYNNGPTTATYCDRIFKTITQYDLTNFNLAHLLYLSDTVF